MQEIGSQQVKKSCSGYGLPTSQTNNVQDTAFQKVKQKESNVQGMGFQQVNKNKVQDMAPHKSQKQKQFIEKYNNSYLGEAPHLWLHLIDRLKQKNRISSFAKAFVKFKTQNY